MKKHALLSVLIIVTVFVVSVNASPTKPTTTAVYIPSQQSAPAAAYIVELAAAAQTTAVLPQLAADLERPLTPRFQYQHAFHGVALTLTPTEAARLTALPDVTAVYPVRAYPLSPLTPGDPIGTAAAPQAVYTNQAAAVASGEGQIIGIISTGINAAHPAFADRGDDGFNHTNPLGGYRGLCSANPTLCNDKLVGLYDFTGAAAADAQGHGTAAAAVAAGNVTNLTLTAPNGYAQPLTTGGAAPHANLIAYDACADRCDSAALLAAIDQAVADGVDSLTLTTLLPIPPYADPVAQALLNAQDAGIFVALPAGDAGEISNAVPWSTTAAAAIGPRQFTVTLSGSRSDGRSFTAAGTALTPTKSPASIAAIDDCTQPFLPGMWLGDVILCNYEGGERVSIGSNLFTGGARGLILANSSAQDGRVYVDAHQLPAIHLSAEAGRALRGWLATGSGHQVQWSRTAVSTTSAPQPLPGPARQANTTLNLLKPELSAPGTAHLAPTSSGSGYAVSSGATLAAAYTAGAAAQVQEMRPTWTPDQQRAALTMTAAPMLLANGNAANPLTAGGGLLAAEQAATAALLLDETRANYEAANPLLNGRPETLNLPTLANFACFQTCTWQRTLRSSAATAVTWTLTTSGVDGLALTVTPGSFTIPAGGSQTLTITADVRDVWSGSDPVFGAVQLTAAGQTPLRLPAVVQKAASSAPDVVQKSGPPYAAPDQIVTYQINLGNPEGAARTLSLTDTLPTGLEFVPGSATGGLSYSAPSRQLTWSGSLPPAEAGYEVTAVFPIDYVNLGSAPYNLDSLCESVTDCDEALVTIDLAAAGESVTLFGESVTSVRVSSNGLLLGPDGLAGPACLACPQPLPSAAPPNQLIAGLWRDVDMNGGQGDWYAAVVSGLLPNSVDKVLYVNWHNAAQFGNPFLTASHAIALVLDGQSEPAGRVYLIYDEISDPDALTAAGYAVGAEDKDGSSGVMAAYAPCREAACLTGSPVGAPPPNGSTLRLEPALVVGGNGRLFTYQARITAPADTLLTNSVTVTGGAASQQAAADTWVIYRYHFPLTARSE